MILMLSTTQLVARHFFVVLHGCSALSVVLLALVLGEFWVLGDFGFSLR